MAEPGNHAAGGLTLPSRAALGTKHGKKMALRPALTALGITLVQPEIDTNRFGIFTAETSRYGTIVDTARAKARAAIAATCQPVGIAREGGSGPQPSIPFLTLGRQMLVWHEGETHLSARAEKHTHVDIGRY